MSLNSSQRQIITRALKIADQRGATPRVRKALLEAMGAESNFTNVNHGDRDSLGVLQQRPSQGWGTPAQVQNVDYAVNKFLDQAIPANNSGGSAGALAQRVQRSAFPERYDQQAGTVEPFLKGGAGASSTGSSSTRTTTTPGVDNSGARGQAIAQWLLSGKKADPVALVAELQGMKDTPATSTSTATRRAPTSAAPVDAAGGGRSGLLELFWQGQNGVNVKDGKIVPQGFVSGHQDHVHVAAGPKTVVALGRLAQSMGLNVGENPAFGTVHPVHVNGSYHYKNEAIDVSGDPKTMAAFAHRVAKSYGL